MSEADALREERDRLLRVVKAAARMGHCSQTHHSFVMNDARAALSSTEPAE